MEGVIRSSVALGAALRRQRRRMRLTQGQLGQRINLRQATISALESGTADAKLSTLMDVLSALGQEIVVRPRSTTGNDEIEAAF